MQHAAWSFYVTCLLLGWDPTEIILTNKYLRFYVWISVHHKLIYIRNQRDATWQYVY